MSENVKHTILRFALVFGVISVMFVVVFLRIIPLRISIILFRSALAFVADSSTFEKDVDSFRYSALG